jgi:translation initiation factor 1A
VTADARPGQKGTRFVAAAPGSAGSGVGSESADWAPVGGVSTFLSPGTKRPPMTDEQEARMEDIRMPDDDEVFAVVEDMLGANRVRARCMDGTTRTARIPGKMQKRIWIREDDVVLVEPWDWQDEKADITWRYEKAEADKLRDEGLIQA